MYLARVTQILALLLLLQGCATTSMEPAEMLRGSWQSTGGGFRLTTTYDANEVTVDGHEALEYRLDGNQLTIAGDETTRRLISFPSRDEMIQVDLITGTEHRFMRAETGE